MPTTKKSTPASVFETPEKTPQGFASKSLILVVVFGIIVVAALGSAIYFYLQYQKSQEMLKTPTAAAEKETQSLVDQVGKLIVLPSGEQPTIATVSDVDKLNGQAFFAQAKNGDKVLIYTKAQKAILYDPAQNKIVEVGPINLAQATPTAAVSPTPANVNVVLYNGTKTVGYTTIIEKQLKTKLPTVTVVDKSNANIDTYTTTTVVDLTGKQAAAASQIASALGGDVGTLPAGEAKPAGADILVILGK